MYRDRFSAAFKGNASSFESHSPLVPNCAAASDSKREPSYSVPLYVSYDRSMTMTEKEMFILYKMANLYSISDYTVRDVVDGHDATIA